jgi:transposase
MILKSNDLSWQRREGYALSTNFKRQCGDHRYRSYGGCPMPRGRPRLPATGNPAKRVSARCHGTLALIRRHAVEEARVGLETGPMTPWLVHELRCRGLNVVCLDARLPAPRSRCK